MTQHGRIRIGRFERRAKDLKSVFPHWSQNRGSARILAAVSAASSVSTAMQ
jgi:hypothetical protein